MALEQEKNGGPYSKDEREKRQKEVSRLHFEFGYSATKIADLMKINRNTINADIKYLYSNIKEELKQDNEDFILRQHGRLEAQRSRIIENITENKIDDIRYEKLLLDIDAKINNMLLRINSDKVTSEPVEIKEDVIKDIILFLIIKHSRDYCLKREEIISEIVNMQHCTIIEARRIFYEMENLGLECCRKFRGHEFVYNLLEFTYLRRYVLANDKFIVIVDSLYILHIDMEAEKIRLKKKYTEKYGGKENWTDEVFEKYDNEENKEFKRYTDATNEMIVEALENLSNKKQVEEYIKYISVFFGKEEEDRFKEFLE